MPTYQEIEDERVRDQEFLERTFGDEVSNALCVFLLDERLRLLLQLVDPMAVRQARAALGLLGKEGGE